MLYRLRFFFFFNSMILFYYISYLNSFMFLAAYFFFFYVLIYILEYILFDQFLLMCILMINLHFELLPMKKLKLFYMSLIFFNFLKFYKKNSYGKKLNLILQKNFRVFKKIFQEIKTFPNKNTLD